LVFQGQPIQEFAIGGQELWIDRICVLTGDPNGGDPNGGDPNGGDPNGGDPNEPNGPSVGDPLVECVDFEDLNLSDVYGVGDALSVANSDGNLNFEIVVENLDSGASSNGSVGKVTVENGGMAGVSGNELGLTNVRIKILPIDFSPTSLGVHFGIQGGKIDVSLNGASISVANIRKLEGKTLGGALMRVFTPQGDPNSGVLVFEGTLVHELSLGGKAIWIDEVCVKPNKQIDVPSLTDPSENPCELVVITAHDDGATPNGGNPAPFSGGWNYPLAKAAQGDFINELTVLGLGFDMVTFERNNGWSPSIGVSDNFVGHGAPYPGGAYSSVASSNGGNMAAGTAYGSVTYYGTDNHVMFSMFDNGHSAGIDEPGIGDMDLHNDTDRGVNTSPEGYHFIEVLPSERSEGGLSLSFDQPVPAMGFNLGGIENGKREINLYIEYANGTIIDRSADIQKGPAQVGGIQFLGFLTADIVSKDCYIKSVTLVESFTPTDKPNDRDIFSIDDVIYVAASANPVIEVSNTPEDADLDGRPDWNDGDSNGNGIPDSIETDLDGDGVFDAADDDADGNGVPDVEEKDSDRDGIVDALDDDDDNDGRPDQRDGDRNGNGIPDRIEMDRDGDGVLDAADTDADGNGIDDEEEQDYDLDGILDFEDEDDDNDGRPDRNDGDKNGNGISDRLETDSDGDGLIDAFDTDDDGNGISDDLENDNDNDGVVDSLDLDDDNDGIPDAEDFDADDNGVYDKLESDFDGDGIPDLLDRDKDGNGVLDQDEVDSDSDGIIDILDDDDDNDGLPDNVDQDDDNDGLPDSFNEDADHNNVPDVYEMDSDLDGHSDGDEFLAGTDPTNSFDILVINKLSLNSNGELILNWESKLGKVYQVQGSGLLDRGLWKNIGEKIIAEGNTTTFLLGRPDTVLHRIVVIK